MADEQPNDGAGVDLYDCVISTSLLQAGFSRLARLCESLQDRVQVLESQQRALRGCLEQTGALRTEAFLAHLHRHSFEATRARHPFSCDASLADMILARDLRFSIGSFAGWAAVRKCGNTCRALKELPSLIPQMIYVCGGFDGQAISASVERLDPKGCELWEAWEATDRMASESKFSCLCGNRKQSLPSTSGTPATAPTSSGAAVNPLDAMKGVWEPAQPMREGRAGFAAAAVSGVLYVCGGYDGRKFLSSVERYTWSLQCPRGVWESMPNMSMARHCPVAAGLNGCLVVCGGYNGAESLISAEQYDISTGFWKAVAPLTQRRHGACGAVIDGKLYLCGGFDGEDALQSAECLDPCLGTWVPIASMSVPRNVALAANLRGKLFVCGGCSGQESLSSVECFDPVTGKWEVCPEMRSSRHGASGAVADGLLFVCGGGDNAGAPGQLLQSVDRYKPLMHDSWQEEVARPNAGGTWSGGVPLPVARGDIVAIGLFTPL